MSTVSCNFTLQLVIIFLIFSIFSGVDTSIGRRERFASSVVVQLRLKSLYNRQMVVFEARILSLNSICIQLCYKKEERAYSFSSVLS